MLFGLSIIAIAGAAGVAIDYGRLIVARDDLQEALDGAVLAAARAKAANLSNAEQIATDFLAANFAVKAGHAAPNVTLTIDASGKVTATAALDVPMTLSRVLGQETRALTARSEAMFGAGDAEIALVVDNTGSMSGSKLAALRDAAGLLLDTVYQAPGSSETVKVGLVPFAKYVNVGLGYRDASWMSVADDTSSTTTTCWNTYPNATKSNCRTMTGTGYNDGVPYQYTYEQCDWDNGDPVEQCGTVTNTTKWYGCVGSRNHPLDVRTAGNFSTRVPGIMNVSCPRPLTRLTSDKSTIVSDLDAMVATGETYIPGGLIWGWRLLAPSEPFGDGADPTTKPGLRKIVVLMTDGANTKSPTYPAHDGGDAATANSLTREVCTNIKAAGAKIYAVAFDVTDTSLQQLLRDCASGPPFYFSAANSSELVDAFGKIGESLVAVRLSK